MAIPPRTLGRPAPGNTNYQGTGAPDQQLDRDEDRIPAFDPDYDKNDRDKDRGGSATNKNVNTVTGGNVTIGDVGSNNVTRINAKNKAQEFKKKKEAVESEEAKADTDADVSNETEQEKAERLKPLRESKEEKMLEVRNSFPVECIGVVLRIFMEKDLREFLNVR